MITVVKAICKELCFYFMVERGNFALVSDTTTGEYTIFAKSLTCDIHHLKTLHYAELYPQFPLRDVEKSECLIEW